MAQEIPLTLQEPWPSAMPKSIDWGHAPSQQVALGKYQVSSASYSPVWFVTFKTL